MQTATTTRISVDSSGMQGNNHSFDPSISADGRYVAFDSNASNLVSGDTNGSYDVFIHDTQTGVTQRISLDSVGVEGNDDSISASISADGRYVAFRSDATNLVSEDTNGMDDIFVHDMQTGVTTRVSVNSSGQQGNHYSSNPSISGDGRYIAFESDANNLVSGDTNDTPDIFVHDTQTGTTTRVSVDSNGTQGDSYLSSSPSISADGHHVVFYSAARNLVSGDMNNASDIFIHDIQTGVTSRLSLDSGGIQGNSYSSSPSISADGLYVAFKSNASNLVSGDTNYIPDIFIVPATVYNLTVTKNGSGSGLVFTNLSSPAGISCGSVCSYDFVSGTTISLSAVPASSSDIFIGWSGDVTSADNPVVFTLNRDMLVNAYFTDIEHFWRIYLPLVVR